ncbi:MAG: cell division protein ZapA [Massiliimalia sp.]
MNRVRVMIAGKDYVFQTEEEEKYVVGLARQLDRKMKEIMTSDQALSLTSACVLAAMDILDEKEKMGTDTDNLRFQIKDYIDEANRANDRADLLEKKIEALESENKSLKNELELYSLKEAIDN